MVTAKSLFKRDKYQSCGGLTAGGRVYTRFENLPEDVKEEYRKEAKKYRSKA